MSGQDIPRDDGGSLALARQLRRGGAAQPRRRSGSRQFCEGGRPRRALVVGGERADPQARGAGRHAAVREGRARAGVDRRRRRDAALCAADDRAERRGGCGRARHESRRLGARRAAGGFRRGDSARRARAVCACASGRCGSRRAWRAMPTCSTGSTRTSSISRWCGETRRRRRWWRARGSIAKRSRRCRCSGSGRRAWRGRLRYAGRRCGRGYRRRRGRNGRPCGAGAGEPLPLVVFDRPCRFFGAATGALDRAGVPWRVAFTTPSLAGLWAAAAAGLGLTVRSQYGLPASVRVLDAASCGLPALPSLPLILLRRTSSATPTVDRLARIVKQAVRDATEGTGVALAA